MECHNLCRVIAGLRVKYSYEVLPFHAVADILASFLKPCGNVAVATGVPESAGLMMRLVDENSLALQAQRDIPGPAAVSILCLSYLPCGERLVVASNDTVLMLNARSLDVLHSCAMECALEEEFDGMRPRWQRVQDLECAPNGPHFAIGIEYLGLFNAWDSEGDSAVELWDADSFSRVVRTQVAGRLSKLTFIAARKHLVAVLQDRAYILDIETLAILQHLSIGERVFLSCLAYAPDANHLSLPFMSYANGGQDGGHIASLDTESYAIVEMHQYCVQQTATSCAYTPNSKFVLIGTNLGYVFILKVRPFELMQQIELCKAGIDQIGVTSNEKFIASSKENTGWCMHTLEVSSLEILQKLTLSCGWASCMACPPLPEYRS